METIGTVWLWGGFTAFVVAMLALDLGVFHRKAHAESVHATDDAFLFEWVGHPVVVVEGSGENIKVTRPEDMVIGEAILGSRTAARSGGS